VLDACLVNGFSAQTVDSIVIASGIATVTRAAGHPFEPNMVTEISGATVTGGSINGQTEVLTNTSTSYTFDATGIPNQTATGTITHKAASLGWGKTFSGTNLAAYRSADVTGTRDFLRVDDTGTNNARTVGYENMTDVNTGTGPFPTSAQLSGGAFWIKSSSATARPWIVFGDSRFFIFAVANTGTSSYSTMAFGDFISYKSPDPFGCLLAAPTVDASDSVNSTTEREFSGVNVASNNSMWYPRAASGLGSSVVGRRGTFSYINSDRLSGADGFTFPNPADNGLYIGNMYLFDSAAPVALRGVAPGFYFCPQSVGNLIYAPRERVSGVTGFPGKTFLAVPNASGVYFVDVVGPWR